MDINVFGEYKAGDMLILNQFVSTSIKPGKAFDKPVRIIIYSPKGTKGVAYIESLSKFPKQREMLFDKECVYEVLSNKRNVIELKVVQ